MKNVKTILAELGNTKVDRRKAYKLVLDVETAGNIGRPMVYDLGFAVCDKKGNIIVKYSFAIKEIFDNKELMDTAYYACKVPGYIDRIEKGEMLKVSFLEAREVFLKAMEVFRIDTVCAYNLMFDMRALKATSEKIFGKGKRFLTSEYKDVDLMCIWSFACEVLFTQKTFTRVATEQEWLTPVGNYKTSAEIAYRYITGDYDFEEEHRGLEDVEIECQILAKCIAQKKKHESGIIPNPWRIPNKK